MVIKPSSFFFVSLFLIGSKGFTQAYNQDSTILMATNNAILLFNDAHNNLGLYNGAEYIGWTNAITGDPYFETKDWSSGDIVYNGQLYSNTPMLYDIVHDNVVIQHYDKFYNIALISEKVNSFLFLGNHFINFTKVENGLSYPGFYQILQDEKEIKLLVRRNKTIRTIPSLDGKFEREFGVHDQYYIEKRGQFYLIKNISDLLNVFADKRNDLQEYLKKIKKDRRILEENLVALTRFYIQLI